MELERPPFIVARCYQWQKIPPWFSGGGEYFPRIGKVEARFFRGLEDFSAVFPGLGKKRLKVSKPWKWSAA
jgi:hypothetical protein